MYIKFYIFFISKCYFHVPRPFHLTTSHQNSTINNNINDVAIVVVVATTVVDVTFNAFSLMNVKCVYGDGFYGVGTKNHSHAPTAQPNRPTDMRRLPIHTIPNAQMANMANIIPLYHHTCTMMSLVLAALVLIVVLFMGVWPFWTPCGSPQSLTGQRMIYWVTLKNV